MEIEKLEIFGFKSFKNKTTLEFNNDGITGIVGPNGCGKSNIVDALLWVMGETSPKNLRSSSLSDVIFSGTTKEAPSGLAEVSLTLGKGTNGFPQKYKSFSEITITRKSFRDEKTEYFINQQPCLLRDIKEIFMDTGAGCKGFSIIEQEAIEKLITAKPQERRFIIEEVAGITKFKTRKGESSRKLEMVHQNLKRLEDIIKTQEKQLNHLSAQAKKADKYRSLKKEISSREIETLYRLYNEISTEQESLKKNFLNQKEEKDKIEKSIVEKQTHLTNIEKDIVTQDHSLERDKTYLSDVNYKALERQKEIEKLEGTINFYNDNIKKQESSQNEQEREIENSKNKIKEARGQKEDLEKKEIELKQELLHIEKLSSEQQDPSLTLKQKEEKEMTLQKIAKEKLDKKAQISGIEKHLEVLTREQNKINSEKQETEQQIKKVLKNKNTTASLLQKNQQMRLNFDKDLSNLKENIKILETKITDVNKEVGQLTQDISLHTYKIEELEKLIHQFENLNEGNSHLSSWKPETFKPLFKSLKIENEFENALSSVLGSHIQLLISKDKSFIAEGIKHLKESKKGKSSFLSSLPTYEYPIVPKKTLMKYPAFICYLEEKIHFNLETDCLRQVVKGTVVVSNLTDAFQLKEIFPSLQFVTKEGDLITRDSIIYGGSSEKETNLFKLHNQIEKNATDLKSKQTILEFKNVHLEKATKQLHKLKDSLEFSQNKVSQNSGNLISYKKDLEQLEKEIINLTELKSSLQKKWDEFEEEKQDLAKHQHSYQTEIKNINEMIEQQTIELKKLQTTEDLYRDKENKKIDLKMKVFQNSQEQSSLEQEIKLTSDFIKKSFSKTKHDEAKNDILNLIKKDTYQIQEIRKELEILLEEKSQLEETISANNKIKEEKKNLKETYNQDLNETQDALTQIAISRSTYQSEQEKLEIKKQNIQEKLYENHHLKMEEHVFVPQYETTSLEDLKSELLKLQEKLQKIQSVNLLALTEYEDLSKNYGFLTHQKEDLINSKKEIHKVISHIDRLCESRFKNMLEEINLRFSKIFPIIFEGDNAEAYLVLQEDPDSTEPGIDIIVRPPGKRPQSVTLLSRGEKALTSICLIYSLFLVKPSPFCIVDEIDSPLDDANIFRLISVLKEMSRKSQIIAITHNKYTMKACKKLYGVTMEQPGISQLVSVDMSKQDLLKLEKTTI